MSVRIVGIEQGGRSDTGVHTIDLWYSARRNAWIVERLDAGGHQIGLAHRCDSEVEAAACLDDWLRAHDETHLVSPRLTSVAEQRILARSQSRRAA